MKWFYQKFCKAFMTSASKMGLDTSIGEYFSCFTDKMILKANMVGLKLTFHIKTMDNYYKIISDTATKSRNIQNTIIR